MSPKTGRPIIGETKKSSQIAFRVTKETVDKFNECQQLSGKSKIQLFEEMLDDLHDKLTKK